ncbi:MAG: LysM peptidoglycan-binding domain-containing protein [Deltaproteobacteria bacterium]|nr:LysM peptidoglycan-binding domain-containing protein [Deltaproteobacteria bacterium]
MSVTVSRGQSLWAIAREHLPEGATRAQVQAAVRDLAQANGLDATSKLRAGQALALPASFTGTLAGNPTTSDALPRLAAGPAPASRTPLATRAAQLAQPRPLLALEPSFCAATRVDEGAVALGPIAGVPVTAVAQRFDGMKSSIGPDSLRTVDVRLGTLTQAQFDAVKTSFGGLTSVTFDPARKYSAVDFLPPALQALCGKDLDLPTDVKLKGTKKIGEINMNPADHTIGLTMNCHATAWEAARAFQGANTDAVSIFYGEMVVMDGLVEEGADFKHLGEVPAEKKEDLLKLDLKPGDIVQFDEVSDWARMTMLLHSAVYVGNGLFFEKPNTEGAEKEDAAHYVHQDETPFRLVTLDMMTAPISQAVDGKYKMTAWRPLTAMKEPRDAFESALEGDFRKYAKGRGAALNLELVSMLEQGMAGNIRGEYASALVTVGLAQNPDGTTRLAPRG